MLRHESHQKGPLPKTGLRHGRGEVVDLPEAARKPMDQGRRTPPSRVKDWPFQGDTYDAIFQGDSSGFVSKGISQSGSCLVSLQSHEMNNQPETTQTHTHNHTHTQAHTHTHAMSIWKHKYI